MLERSSKARITLCGSNFMTSIWSILTREEFASSEIIQKSLLGLGPVSLLAYSRQQIYTNPRTENACLQIGEGIYSFYKTYFDGIITFEKDDRERQSEEHDA